MAQGKVLRIYLDNVPRERAAAGNFNVINKIFSAFESVGYRVELRHNSQTERGKSAMRKGYSLFHMDDPFHSRALTLRKAYFYPFWRIEATAKRWKWDVAQKWFLPGGVNEGEAKAFCDAWRRRLYPDLSVEPPDTPTVYVPLQGKLTEHRSFQSTSPIEMIEAVLTHDPQRLVLCSLHPGETYLPGELDALKALIDQHPRLQLTSAPMETLLSQCDYVVTQNSGVALNGFFLHKPAVLFGRIDFHHIGANVLKLGEAEAIRSAPAMKPDFDGYMYWFLQQNAINAGAPDTEAQILDTVRRHGWKV